ncbi:ADP-ribosyl-[dinitrogen reductase] hydrolase [Thermochromatium tepidum]|jgi:ADP-ribosyl-[dinitrogen reductase] hydrolase|uniref:ADP-ribosyl-[dinitrogen reductase] hydrolase n=1 Tax=Thermochromatium tepidum ATCC 43061 TaxID=316276 RepID=A0A6I6EDY2_THETI|nr:ADP-ribosyl-[dinitrogen reductase] hydrolase [Thermochromatium tepidum]QGU33179.1 ADP-ribosyl-[dinitrogen reductase] hydrolase [Thermochromatium tepidum ATCC 43061]
MRTSSSNIPVAERAEAAYLGLAIGDALGATVEFMTPHEIRVQFAASQGVHRELIGGGWLRLKPGQVTDDTSLSLALGAAILTADGRVEPLACAQAFEAWMRSKPVDIGNTIRRNLLAFRRTGHPVAPPSEHDAGNGAAMRVLPVALATLGCDPATVAQAVLDQAHVTHNNPVSDAVCLLLVRLLQAALRGRSLPQLYRTEIQPFIQLHPYCALRPHRRDNPSGWVVETLQAVLQALLDTSDFEECLIDVVNRGGDADTTGAIAGMLAGALYGLDAIPRGWQQALDPRIATSCRGQAQALLALAPGS